MCETLSSRASAWAFAVDAASRIIVETCALIARPMLGG